MGCDDTLLVNGKRENTALDYHYSYVYVGVGVSVVIETVLSTCWCCLYVGGGGKRQLRYAQGAYRLMMPGGALSPFVCVNRFHVFLSGPAGGQFEDFFEEVYQELSKFGEICEMNVCDNLGDHLIGNVYVKVSGENFI